MIEFLVAGLFTDHMVLQQQRSNPVWGWDQPGQVVTLSVEGAQQAPVQVRVTTAADGTWRLLCPELPVGGPYTLRVKGSAEQVISDVLVGEVWVASGQSNMNWQLSNTDTGPADVQAANCPQVRAFRVSQQASREPQQIIGGSWAVCSPGTAGSFSAVAYHFAQNLHRQLKVPVGIIDASWGGTRIEAWTSEKALEEVMDLRSEMTSLESAWAKLPGLKSEFGKKAAEWEAKNFPADPGNAGETQGWAQPGFDDSAWATLQAPGQWDQQGLGGPGVVWYRRTVDIPASWAGRELRLNLGALKDFDVTYFNGERVGGLPKGTWRAANVRRDYLIPGKLVKAGRTVIAVRVFDQNGGGGLLGPGPLMGLSCNAVVDTPRLRLAGAWRARQEASVSVGNVDWSTNPWPDFNEEQFWPSTISNGMISPIAGYGARGFVWYQGETNCDVVPHTYGPKLQSMIRDWRTRWGQGDMPFVVVQLPNFKSNDGWPIVREGQAAALGMPATSLVCSIDLGNPDDIHPRNKSRIGARIADNALASFYGLPILGTAPLRDTIEIRGTQVIVRFRHATGLRTRDGGPVVKAFELAGADGVWHAAQARIEGETVIVECPEVPEPKSVRHAWAPCPEVNLENKAGLPAHPFRL